MLRRQDDPHIAAAQFAWQQAPQSCVRDDEGGQSCLWYHRVRPLLGLLGLVGSVSRHGDFLRASLREAAAHGARRIMICGAADAGILEELLAAAGSGNGEFEITVLDRCPIPLAACAQLAEQMGIRLRTIRADIRRHQADVQYDVVVAHSFLGFFPAPDRARVVRAWRALLGPGGRVVTVKRVRPNYREDLVAYTPQQAEQFADEAVRRLGALGDDLGISADQLRSAVMAYARNMRTYAIRSTDEIEAIFGQADFRRIRCERSRQGDPARVPARGLDHGHGSFHALIVAETR